MPDPPKSHSRAFHFGLSHLSVSKRSVSALSIASDILVREQVFALDQSVDLNDTFSGPLSA